MKSVAVVRIGLTVALLLGAACGRPSVTGKRVIVLGFDGLDYGVAPVPES